MRGRTRAVAAAALSSLVLMASACGGGDTAPEPATGGGSGAPGVEGGAVTIYGCAPQKGLLPGLTSEACGGDILDAVTAKLVHYDTKTAAPENDIAESIESKDNQTFTVKLKPGYKFSDGTEVKATNFTDAWSYAANCNNGQDSNYFFGPIEGYKEINTTDCKGVDEKTKTDRSQGGRRHHLHHQDHREGLQPAGPARLHRLRAAAGLLLQRGRQGSGEDAGQGRALHDRRQQHHRGQADQEPQLLGDLQAAPGRGHRPDLRRQHGGLHRPAGQPAGLHPAGARPTGWSATPGRPSSKAGSSTSRSVATSGSRSPPPIRS